MSLTSFEASSGPAISYYRLNNGPVMTYSAPFQVTAEGTTTVRYWSKDNAPTPNVEAVQSRLVRIDRSGPVMSTDAKAEYGGPATVAFRAIDPYSGVGDVFWDLDGRLLRDVADAGRVTVTSLGRHTLTFHAWDRVGNEASRTVEFVVKRALSMTKAPAASSVTLTRRSGVATWRPSVTLRSPGAVAGKRVILQKSTDGRRWTTAATATSSATGVARASIRISTKGRTYWRWYAASDATYAAAVSARTTLNVR